MSDCAQTPLTDLLDGIPPDARMTYEIGPTHHHMIPVGRHAAEASARIKALERENAELRKAQPKVQCFGKGDLRCNYLANCGSICNKCGREHDGQRSPLWAAERFVRGRK